MPRHDDPAYPGCPVTVTDAIADGVQLRPARWDIVDIVVMLVITAGLAICGGAFLRAVGAPLPVVVIVGGLLGWIGLAGWPLVVTARRGNGPRIDLGLILRWSDVRAGVGWGLLALAAAGLVGLVLVRVIGPFQSAAGEVGEQLIADGDRWALLVFGAMILIGAPIVEELAFRGLVFGVVRKRGASVLWTVVISAVAFALVHAEPTRIPVLLAIGLVLGAVRARTGSTGASMVAHAVVNAPGAVLLVLGLPGMTP